MAVNMGKWIIYQTIPLNHRIVLLQKNAEIPWTTTISNLNVLKEARKKRKFTTNIMLWQSTICLATSREKLKDSVTTGTVSALRGNLASYAYF